MVRFLMGAGHRRGWLPHGRLPKVTARADAGSSKASSGSLLHGSQVAFAPGSAGPLPPPPTPRLLVDFFFPEAFGEGSPSPATRLDSPEDRQRLVGVVLESKAAVFGRG